MEAVYPRQGSLKLGGRGEPTTYMVSFPWVLNMSKFLVTGSTEVAHSAGRLREHFMYQHFFCGWCLYKMGKCLCHTVTSVVCKCQEGGAYKTLED